MKSARERLLASTMFCGAAFVAFAASPAFAQEGQSPTQGPVVGTEDPADRQERPDEVEELVVTGSRIVRQDYVANSPIVTVTGEATTANADITLETFLNTLPQVNPAGSTTSNNPGNNGQANIDLRGLGANRNIILVDGRRPMVSSNTLVVDVNTIPQALIDNIEIITGGAGAAYGADAIAGAVNIRLKDDFEGLDVRANYTNSTEFWDAEEYQFSAVFGGNFADDRGNMVVAFDRAYREPLIKSQREFAAQATSTTSFFPEGNFFYASSNAPTEAAFDAIFATYGSPAANQTLASGRIGFNLDGTLFYSGVFNNPLNVVNYRYPLDGTVNLPLYPDIYSYNFDFVNLLVLPMDRYSFMTKGEYKWDNGIEVFGQAGWTEYNAATALAPTPIPTVSGRAPGNTTSINQYTSTLITPTGSLANVLVIPTTNPFIPAQLATLLASRTGDDPNIVGAGATEPFRLRQRTLGVGLRLSEYENTVVQFLAGVRGPIWGTGWNFEAYVSEGRTEVGQTQTGNVDTQRLQTLLEAADGGASICDGGFNPFGRQPISPECVEYLEVSATLTTDMKMQVGQVFVTGDLFSLPAGTVQAVLGAEYRGFEYAFDPGSAGGPISGFTTQNPEGGTNSFRDFFGELLVPIVRDLPFAQSIDLNLGYRRSSSEFTDEIGGTTSEGDVAHAYKAEIDWRVMDPLRIRSSLQRSVRAPNFGELFAGGGSAPQYFDPCSITSNARQGANAAQLAALCTATGLSGVDSFVQTPGNQLSITTAGNVDLEPEIGTTFTLGAVWTSPWESQWLQRLRGSVDYYRIKIEDAILVPTPNQIVAACYNYYGTNPTYSAANPNCGAIVRAGGDILVLYNPADPVNGFFNNENDGYQETSGIDFQVDYGFDMEWLGLPQWGSWRMNLVLTHLLSFEQQDPVEGAPPIEFAGSVSYFGAGLGTSFPEWKGVFNARWDLGNFNLTNRVRYIGEMENRLAREFPGEDEFTGPERTFYWDAIAGYKITQQAELRLGVNNVLNQEARTYAPNVQSGTDPSTYDVIGRRVVFGVNLRF
ncbi:MAG TPA: TonB-dependent receptor [Caulobacteraceae bacterium]|jgi:outer membrane receptor protein involved in Fe transport